jgi:hypothetical protein
MVGLSDSQLEIILDTAEPLPEDKCRDFLERVAAVLQTRGQINDDDVAAAVKQALRALIYSTAAWKEWWGRNTPSVFEDAVPSS